MKQFHIEDGQTWEAMTGGRGAPRIRSRRVVSIEGGNVAVEEDGTIKCSTITSFRSWISNYGAKKVENV